MTVLLAPIVLCSPCWRHDLEVAALERRVRDLPLPPEARVAAHETEFGLIWCCSDHCDVRILERLEGSADPAAIDAALQSGLPLPGAFSSDPAFLQLLAVGGDQIEEVAGARRTEPELDTHEEEALRGFAGRTGGVPALVLAVTDQSYARSDLLDWRCD